MLSEHTYLSPDEMVWTWWTQNVDFPLLPKKINQVKLLGGLANLSASKARNEPSPTLSPLAKSHDCPRKLLTVWFSVPLIRLTPRNSFTTPFFIFYFMSTTIAVAFPDYINQRYKRALGLVRNLPKKSLFQPSNADKLKLYGLYKQASFGDINTPQPDRWDLLNRAKWYTSLLQCTGWEWQWS